MQCHNLALVHLNQSITYSTNIRPLCLPLTLRLRKPTYDNAYLYVAFIAALVDDTYIEDDFRALLMNPSALNAICIGSAGTYISQILYVAYHLDTNNYWSILIIFIFIQLVRSWLCISKIVWIIKYFRVQRNHFVKLMKHFHLLLLW